MVTRLVWTTWTPMSTVPKKAVKLNHSLTHFTNFRCHRQPVYMHSFSCRSGAFQPVICIKILSAEQSNWNFAGDIYECVFVERLVGVKTLLYLKDFNMSLVMSQYHQKWQKKSWEMSHVTLKVKTLPCIYSISIWAHLPPFLPLLYQL